MTQELNLQTPCALHTPSRRTWRIRRSGVYPQPILSPWHARSVAVAAAALLHAAVMRATGGVFLSCCHYVRATGYGLARPSISEWVDIWGIEGLLTQKLYRNGCIVSKIIIDSGIWSQLYFCGCCKLRGDGKLHAVCRAPVLSCQARATVGGHSDPVTSARHPH